MGFNWGTYDYLIVGSGFFGAICAHELSNRGFSVAVIDSRNHIGGNCYTEKRDNINIHFYGPHIFHTSDAQIWNWINKFAEFNNFIFSPVAYCNGETYSLPFNMWTFSKILGITHPTQFDIPKGNPSNFEEAAIQKVGEEAYKKLIYGYTKKQWKKEPRLLPASIIDRLPVRDTYDNNYFNDKYQGIPIGGYTKILQKLLAGNDVFLGVDYFRDELPRYDKLIYTGPIDRFFDYQFGELEYKSNNFRHIHVKSKNFQGCAAMNYTDEYTPWTRITEHKHFENTVSDTSWITIETPQTFTKNSEPLYPVNDNINNAIYNKYQEIAAQCKNVYFGGRLAEYKYYDMDKVIKSAFNFLNQKIGLSNCEIQ